MFLKHFNEGFLLIPKKQVAKLQSRSQMGGTGLSAGGQGAQPQQWVTRASWSEAPGGNHG